MVYIDNLVVFLLIGCGSLPRLCADQNTSPVVDDKCVKPTRDCSPTVSRSSSYCYETRTKYKKKATGGSWWRSTKYYKEKKTYKQKVCCSGHSGSSCYPTCHGSNSMSSCNRYEGNIIHKDGTRTTCSGGGCSDTDTCEECNTGYYASSDGYCRACKSITNCDVPTCSNGDSSECLKCSGEVKCDTPGLYVYTKLPDKSKCQRACSWKTGYRCYPGTCGTGDMVFATDCECAEGYGSRGDCNVFSSSVDELLKPQVLSLEAFLERDNNPRLVIPDPSYPDQKVWTNVIEWSKVEIIMKSDYKGPEVDDPPPYIVLDRTKIGVKSVEISAVLQRGTVTSTLTKENTSCGNITNCPLTIDPIELKSTPWNSILRGSYPTPFVHLDSITFTAYVENGGIVYYNDWDSQNSASNHYKRERYYSVTGITVSKTVRVGIDLYTPTHCAESSTPCSTEPLVVQDFFESASIDVTWTGWEDADSGLHVYEVHLYPLKVYDLSVDDPILQQEHILVFDTVVNATDTGVATVPFEHPGPYYVELVVFDWAGNHKSTRRICLFDNNSTVELIGDPTNVTLATLETERTWINKGFTELVLVWPYRFINTKHHANKWLNAVEGLDHIARELDDTADKSERTTEKYHNIQGIVRVDVAYQIDTGFGNAPIVNDFVTVPLSSFDDQQYLINEVDTDGEMFTFRTRGYDVLEKYAEDTYSVKIDTSPAIIEYLWLTKGDFVNISVHDVEEFKDLTIEWEVYDPHSGIYEISWRLFDNYTGEVILHGNADERPQGDAATLEDCETKYGAYARGPNCYCTPFDGCHHRHYQLKPLVSTTGSDGLHSGKHTGVHESDYFIEVVVINRARLETKRDFKITIDTSPPHEGSVHDGLAGENEIDFQQSLSLASNWNGFFDKESGVWFYLYKYGTACVPNEEFDLTWEEDHTFTKTYNTEGHFEASEPGTFYVTVAAYNHALDHSLAVCSDGVTIDADAAQISEVVVKGSVTKSGLVKTADNTVMFLHTDRTVQTIENPSQECVDKAVLLTDAQISMFPERRDIAGQKTKYIPSSPSCSTEDTRENHLMGFVTSDSHLDISWNVSTTSSGIHNFEVGLASVEGTNPDKLNFMSSKQHQRMRLLYPNIWNGEEFYILLKSVTKASTEHIQTVGPFIVCKTASSFTGTVTVNFESGMTNDYVIASWTAGSFVCECDPYQLHLEVGIGSNTDHANVLSFRKLSTGGSCTDTIMCTAIDVGTLPWRMNGYTDYHVIIKATNVAGRFTLASSIAYKYDVELASPGVVLDIDKDGNNLFDDTGDIDFQVKTNELTASWTGFKHPYMDIRYIVCVQEQPLETYIKCEDAGTSEQYTMTGLVLEMFKTYVQVVIAETNFGNISASSDGITIFEDGTPLQNVVILDGQNLMSRARRADIDDLHHDTDRNMAEIDDLEYQRSTTELHAHWDVPDDMTHYTSDIYWSIEERAGVVEHWETVQDYQYHRFTSNISVHGLFLEAGRKYRFSVKFCAAMYCFQPLKSNGVMIIPSPPVTGSLIVDYNNVTRLMSVEIERFYDPDIPNFEEAVETIDHYEWTITDDSHHGNIIFKWSHVKIDRNTSTKIWFEESLEKDVLFTKCWRLSVRGYTKAGLYSTVSDEIRNCSDPKEVKPADVIDATGIAVLSEGSLEANHEGQAVTLALNADWNEADKDYTTYSNVISAVWPKLRYKTYDWAVIEAVPTDPALYYKATSDLELLDPCSHPDTIACGQTDDEYMNAMFTDGILLHGRRYVVCIHANATVNVFEKWEEELPEISVCSNGITVDLTPPITNDVWIGTQQGQKYQTGTSDISVNWKSFIDVEEEGNGVHQSGIMKYEVAIGSAYNGVDIVDFMDVGVTNHMTFHGLSLQQGYTYFATVKATDFVNQAAAKTSPSIKVDKTAPELTGNSITLKNRRITSTTAVYACWTSVFVDTESGISHYEWAVGSHPGYDDLYSYTVTDQECGENGVDQPLSLIEGHSYFISVKAHNNAGLVRTASSWAFTVDATAPKQAHVYDGPKGENGNFNDIDYVTNSSVIEAHWTEFYDHHSAVVEYYVFAGSCRECDDILPRQPVGIIHDLRLDNIHLIEGIPYYVSVTACNAANLCSTSTSNGFLVDSSPPMAGRVLDGIEGHDVQYQASRVHLGAEWFGFVDPQSGISHYVWRVGTVKYADDILAAMNVHTQLESYVIDYTQLTGAALPVGTRLYSTIRAYNNAGMYVEVCSNGFIIDDSAPIFESSLSQSNIGTISEGTSVLPSALKVQWEVTDEESFIEEQYLSISSHAGGDFSLSSIKVEGIVRDYTFTDLQLHDGSYYDVHLIACNGAKQCSESSVTNILVDRSHPTPGMFAIDTDHAANLNRQPDGWMSWTVVGLRLAWLGFEDIHSGINKYLINVGTSFFNDDLNKSPGVPISVEHDDTGAMFNEGKVQVVDVQTAQLTNDMRIFISMWALNKVGLPSPVLHGEFELIFGGIMSLVRRCNAHNCYGHCVCAPHGETCESDTLCTDVTIANDNTLLDVEVFIDLVSQTTVPNVFHSPVNSLMGAKWTESVQQGKSPLWYEWSVGESIYDVPKGVFNEADERVWHDAGRNTSWILTLTDDHLLKNLVEYCFFVRVWYDINTFAIFKSNNMMIYASPPLPVTILGKSVKEMSPGKTIDIDYFDRSTEVLVNWDGKFNDNKGSLERYHVYISSSCGGHDVHVLGTDLDPTAVHINITGLNFENNTRYYGVVQAYNKAGLHTTQCSDGFSIDSAPPNPGIVHDGDGLFDTHAINSSDILSGFWFGFTDLESGIKTYETCISTRTNGRCDIKPWTSVGMATHAVYDNPKYVDDGTIVYHYTRAEDAAGHKSEPVRSSGVYIDRTAPIRSATLNYGNNIVSNHSFEQYDTPTPVESFRDLSTCNNIPADPWMLGSDTCIVHLQASVDNTPDGTTFIVLSGSISQNVGLLDAGKYRVSFYTSHVLSSQHTELSSAEGYVDFIGQRHVFLIHSKPSLIQEDHGDIPLVSWQQHHYYFHLDQSEEVTITVGTARMSSHFAVDNIQIQSRLVDESMMETASQGHVDAQTVFTNDWSSVHAEWNFIDEESTIVEYLWAIGTVQGGTQLQDFKTVGRQTFAYTYDLHLIHNSVVYVTVVAVNRAGLRTLSYSAPIIIDKTPPAFTGIYDGDKAGKDLDVQKGDTITVNWGVEDPESKIKQCQWAIGDTAGDTSIQSFTILPQGAYSASVVLNHPPITPVYVTLKCTNNAFLTTTIATDGVILKSEAPSADGVLIDLLGVSGTQYIVHDGYHADPTFIKFRWTGFHEEDGISSFLVGVEGPGLTDKEELVQSSTSGFSYASFQNLTLQDSTYFVYVTAINQVGMYSTRVTKDFIILTEPPSLTGTQIATSWDLSQRTFSVNWAGVFTSNNPMYYEVTAKLAGGEGDIIQWQETTDTALSIILDTSHIVGDVGEVLVSVRAITYGGQYTIAKAETSITFV